MVNYFSKFGNWDVFVCFKFSFSFFCDSEMHGTCFQALACVSHDCKHVLMALHLPRMDWAVRLVQVSCAKKWFPKGPVCGSHSRPHAGWTRSLPASLPGGLGCGLGIWVWTGFPRCSTVQPRLEASPGWSWCLENHYPWLSKSTSAQPGNPWHTVLHTGLAITCP